MNDTNCLFCKIIAGEIPAEKVYEDEKTFAFLDIKPVNPGHTLVIPKDHHVNMLETPEETLCAMTATVKKVAMAIQAALNPDGINLGVNNGAAAGQVIFHAHMHVMPRRSDDGYGLWHGKPYTEGQANEIATKIKNAL